MIICHLECQWRLDRMKGGGDAETPEGLSVEGGQNKDSARRTVRDSHVRRTFCPEPVLQT